MEGILSAKQTIDMNSKSHLYCAIRRLTPPHVVSVQSEPVPSQDKGGGFRGGLATRQGKKHASNRNNAPFSLLQEAERKGGRGEGC